MVITKRRPTPTRTSSCGTFVSQNVSTTLAAGFPSTWGGVAADYGMDPDVIGYFNANGTSLGGDLFGGQYAAAIRDSLLSIPTMSIVMDTDEMFGPNGIYTNSTNGGVAYERATSVEIDLSRWNAGLPDQCRHPAAGRGISQP